VVGIERLADSPYRWRTNLSSFEAVGNLERRLPAEFISLDGFGVTDAFRRWCRPLIEGEDWPKFAGGLPDYLRLQLPLLAARLPGYAP
jgi:6-phosphofructokinase 1